MGHRILLIDDHAALRRGIQQILSDAFPTALFGDAHDARSALSRIRDSAWDLAILDLNLPGRGGLDLIRALKDEQPKLGILVYSVHPETQFGVRSIRAGADGYLAKDRPVEEIVDAAAKILGGGQYISSELASIVVTTVQGAPEMAHRILSDRELQVLRLIASGKTPTEIGDQLSLSAKTVSTYRARVLEKLNMKTNADLVRYAIEQGILE